MSASIEGDDEVAWLTAACGHKLAAMEALAAAARARKARGADTTGIEQSIDLENMTRSGYQLALDKRKRELRGARGAK